DLSGNPSREGLHEIASSPMTSLRKLDLSDCGINAITAGRLADAANLSSLRWLGLDTNPIGAEGIRRLASSPHLAGLQTLRLAKSSLDDDALTALAASPYLRPHELPLENNLRDSERLGLGGWLALAGSPVLENVASIKLSFCPVGDAVIVALAGNAQVTGLRK